MGSEMDLAMMSLDHAKFMHHHDRAAKEGMKTLAHYLKTLEALLYT